MGIVNTNTYLKIYKIKTIREISPQELKRRWRILIQKYHPDHKPYGDADKFRIVNNAYHYLVELKKDDIKKESKIFYNNKDLLFYGNGSVYSQIKKRWIKFKGQKINVTA